MANFGLATGVGMDLFNAGASIWATKKQLELQREAWSREDTAVQRRADDLARAGLNPVLAAGSAAAASGPVQMRSPGFSGENSRQNALAVAQVKQAEAGIAQTRAQVDLIRAQQRKLERETLNLGYEGSFAEQTLQDRIDRVAIARDTESVLYQTRQVEQQVARLGLDRAWLESVESRIRRAYMMGQNQVTLYPAPGSINPATRRVWTEEERLASPFNLRISGLRNPAALELAIAEVQLELGRAQTASTRAGTNLTQTQNRLAPWNTVFNSVRSVVPFVR